MVLLCNLYRIIASCVRTLILFSHFYALYGLLYRTCVLLYSPLRALSLTSSKYSLLFIIICNILHALCVYFRAFMGLLITFWGLYACVLHSIIRPFSTEFWGVL